MLNFKSRVVGQTIAFMVAYISINRTSVQSHWTGPHKIFAMPWKGVNTVCKRFSRGKSHYNMRDTIRFSSLLSFKRLPLQISKQ